MTDDSLVIHKLFSQSAGEFSDKVALQIKKENQWQRLTYRNLEISSHRVASFLIQQGFKNEECASLILENRPEWAVILLGIISAGLICVPFDPQLNIADLKNYLLDSSSRVIFCSLSIFLKIKPYFKDYPAKFIVLDMPASPGEGVLSFSQVQDVIPKAHLFPESSPQDPALLVYTSGTTGKPKGVLLTHKNLCSDFKSLIQLNIYSSQDNILSILPLYHTYAFMVNLLVPILCGGRVTYCPSFNPQEITQLIKETKVTVLVGVPQLFSLLHKTIFEKIERIPYILRFLLFPLIKIKVRNELGRSLRLLVSGGARLEPKINRDLSRLGFKLIEGYGLTETAPVVTLNPPGKVKIGSVGKPIPGVQIKIISPDNQGIGGVLIKGDNVMSGYFKRPDLTQEVIKEGWFYSGDLGFIDKEGYLYLVGRDKEIIVLSSGKNIYPEELEEYYARSPYIKEICILAKSEERFGRLAEALHAIVVPNLEYLRQKNETDIQGKIRWELENLSRGLPSYKHIMGFSVTKEELPRTVLKKIKRYEVKQRYLEDKILRTDLPEAVFSEEDSRLLDTETAEKIMRYLIQEINKPINLNSHLEIDLGIDSLARVELGLGLESLLKIKIPEEFLYRISTVKDIIQGVSGMSGEAISQGEAQAEVKKDWAQIIREMPSWAIQDKINLKVRFIDKLLTLIFSKIFLFLFRIFWSLKIKGKEFLPAQGPYLICSNHASYLDPFVISSSLPLNVAVNTFFVGYSQILERPLISWAIKLSRMISIDPNVRLTEAMQAVSFIGRHKKIVVVFPEGRRSIDENIGEFKKGVGILVKELDIPVIPVYIKGSHYSWPRTKVLPRFYPLEIIFGRPFSLSSSSAGYEEIAGVVREEVLKLAC